MIDETVLDLATHEARMKDPASYRPVECRCGCDRLHLHDRRDRKVRGGAGLSVVSVVIFLCAKCSATWRVLPAFLARCLWRTWAVVAAVLCFAQRRGSEPEVPLRTQQRWRARLAQAARVPMQILASSGDPTLRGMAQQVGLEGSRQSLVKSSAAFFGVAVLPSMAGLLHRLSPGIRLM